MKAVAALADYEYEIESHPDPNMAVVLGMYQQLVIKYREVCWEECQAMDSKRASYDEITNGAQQLQQFVKVTESLVWPALTLDMIGAFRAE